MFFLPACFENAISSFGKCVSNSVNTKEVSAETNSCDGTFGFSSCSHIFPTKKRRASSRLRFVSSSSISFWSIPLRNDWKDIKFQFTTFSIVYQNNKTSSMTLLFLLTWWDASHGMIARIAQREITSKQNQWITSLFNRWAGEEGDMVSLAGWQDDIKGKGVYPMGNWHFINQPFIDSQSNMSKLHIKYNYNVTSVCRDLIETIMDKTTTNDWALGFALRSLVHFIGDAHCPMHSVSFYSDEYPNGDKGGNAYYIHANRIDNETKCLHMLWDNAGLSFKKTYPHDIYESNTTKIIKKYPRNTLKKELDNLDPKLTYAKEANDIATTFAYTIAKNAIPSEEYLKKARELSQKQIALGGYRLADVLNNFFSSRGMVNIPNKESYKIRKNEVVAWCLVVLCLVVIIISYICDFFKSKSYGIRSKL